MPINQRHDTWKTRILELLSTWDANYQGRSPASLIDLSGRVSSYLDSECLDRLVTPPPYYDLQPPVSSYLCLWG